MTRLIHEVMFKMLKIRDTAIMLATGVALTRITPTLTEQKKATAMIMAMTNMDGQTRLYKAKGMIDITLERSNSHIRAVERISIGIESLQTRQATGPVILGAVEYHHRNPGLP